MRIAVIGGGASGIMAAIRASQCGAAVTVYERMDRIGKKILATGNGRCNLTNRGVDVTYYHGSNPKFVISALSRFSVDDTLDFFAQIGLLTRTEDRGKVYPYCGQASAVLDVLRAEMARLGIKIVPKFEAAQIQKQDGGFLLKSYDGRNEYADRVILAAGGRASPSLGSNGSGYDIAVKLGHTVTSVSPVLVQIKTDTPFIKGLKGLKVNGKLTIEQNGKIIGQDSGEILFADYGISGPPVFQLSRYAQSGAIAVIDIMPEYQQEEIAEMLSARRRLNVSLEDYFTGMLMKRLGQTLLKVCGITPLSRASSSLSDRDVSLLAATIKAWRLPITGTLSWNNAQVTSGGVLTKEISPSTMESKCVPGLYITGELLDIDGDCGGYNLQWAWSSGYVAGEAAAT